MARNTWRFNFIDINNSVTQTEADDAEIIGYMPVRASKGTTTGFYFKPGSKSEIEAMFGAGNADYPDITEAIEFNKKWGLYLSAPPGGTLRKPSTYGGLYITSRGLFNFYKVEDKENPGFIGLIDSQKAKGANGDALSSLSLKIWGLDNADHKSDDLSISGVTPELKNLLKGVVVTWDGEKHEFALEGNDFMDANGNKAGTLEFDSDASRYSITIQPGRVADTKKLKGMYSTPNDNKIFYEDFANLGDEELAARVGANVKTGEGGFLDSFAEAYLTGEKFDQLYSISKDAFRVYTNNNVPKMEFLVDVSNDTYKYIAQKSPTSNITNITINSIGYDKYLFDDQMYFTNKTDLSYLFSLITPEKPYISKNTKDVVEAEAYKKATKFINDNIDFFNKECIFVRGDENDLDIYRLAKVNEQDDDGFLQERIYLLQNNNAFNGRRIKVAGTISPSKAAQDDAYGIENKIYISLRDADADDTADCYIFQMVANPEDDSRKKLAVNPDYNTLSFTQTEEINGDLRSCGTFKGSCDLNKLDEYQAPLAWNEVLPNDSVSFVEVYPIKTFDADLDDGSFTGVRIENSKYEISGYRYVSDIVAENKAAGFTGGSMDNQGTVDEPGASKKFSAIIQAGLTEAMRPIYEEVAVFIEPTGDKSAKTQLVSLRETKKFSTMVSPRLLTNSEFNDTQSIIVADRHRGGVQYAGEFLVKDANGQTYWSSLIGSIGSILAQNDDEWLGGKAPAWVNDKNFGGQIDREVIKARWDFEDDDTKVMDEKGLNPIILDAEYGVMIVSQKTTELNAGDWSKIAHQMSFDLCKRHIKDKVMVPLLMKRINDYWMKFAKEGLKKILDKRLEGDDPIWAEAVPYVNSVNTAQTKDESNFMLKVVVKVNPVAEKVTLTFENTAQGTEITEE